MIDLGVEAYKEAVRDYYEEFSKQGVDSSQRSYARWVVRQVLRSFETHVRGYRRQDVGRRGGALFHAASDELTLPQTLWESGRLVADLRYHIARFQVRSDLRETCEKLCLAKLRQAWGLR